MQEKALNWLDRLTKSARLTPKRILKIYTFVLFFAPLAYLLLLQLRAGAAKQTITDSIAASPATTVSIIVAAGDFLLGYLCWIDGGALLADRRQYMKFMKLQLWTQLIVGNWFCFLFAIFALRRGEDLPEESKVKPSQLLSLTYLIASLFVICFVFYVVLAFRAVKG
ncbi:hypothetical protein [Lactobacillus delbrueckii]|jgi:hypothetical protein|uniref:Uncharacterized protein n=1 Tax=Lactobacillus delbrueckii subsp. allosunkii TaxID=1050107 RepID=A0ABD4SFJ5_9LACO|nr:hypothetical protein [Lactobacillus delbrueckii]MCD5518721.1 hypothetical protein [Lactobacillus delbrueckii subsp. sunkii]MCT3477044.1 hypothetical protein [Lactobacillus delbrueckii subsp. lactis]MDK8262553.1 hypothetical protein [Lactobacillus delbrueckii]UYX12449.1 hypothetical protein OJ966_08160 [Lactobacillus delbrueckii]UYY84263.1 hypothetical protein OKX59_07830 [Lactobacillus delbrueckii subsp. indicus]